MWEKLYDMGWDNIYFIQTETSYIGEIFDDFTTNFGNIDLICKQAYLFNLRLLAKNKVGGNTPKRD